MPRYEFIYIDLDETLYPKTNGLWKSISDRIDQFMVQRLQISSSDAQELRKHYLNTYGTTLNGLLTHHNIDPMEYLEFVHDIPVELMIEPEPELRGILEQMDGKRFIFTNASIQHAHRILNHLKILDLFDGVIDILALEFVNKPRKEAYEKALALTGYPNVDKCLLVDDRIANLIPAKEMGINTVLVGEAIQNHAVDYVIHSMKEILDKVPGLK
jgi:putative hydrolase of the HAD superfamily